jgi:hypothetical protein
MASAGLRLGLRWANGGIFAEGVDRRNRTFSRLDAYS